MSEIKGSSKAITDFLANSLNVIGNIVKFAVRPVVLGTVTAGIFLHERYENNFVRPAQFNSIALDSTTIDKNDAISFHGQAENGQDTTLNFNMLTTFEGLNNYAHNPDIYIFKAYGDSLRHNDDDIDFNNDGTNLAHIADHDYIFNDFGNTSLLTTHQQRAETVSQLTDFANTKNKQTGRNYSYTYKNDGDENPKSVFYLKLKK